MRLRLVTTISIASILLASACAQSNQNQLPAATNDAHASATIPNGFATSKDRAQLVYFAGIQPGSGGGGFLGPGQLGVYPSDANGNVAPQNVIAGKRTGLDEAGGCCVPQSAWFDAKDRSIWTCRTFSKFISRFSIKRGAASWGNVNPAGKLTISPKTVSCGGVAVTKGGEIVADDINRAFVVTWPPHSVGSAAPIRKIAGPATGLYLPSAIAFDGRGDYIVSDRCTPPQCSTDYGGVILTFAATANGNVAPLRSLTGSKTQLSGPDRIAYDPVRNMIYAANIYSSTITAYPANASGNVKPTIFIHGKKTDLWNPDAIAIDKAGYLYVGNEPIVPGPPPASILVFAPGANGNVAPVQIIQGSNTGLAEVNGISVY